jgi:hypothetical protein
MEGRFGNSVSRESEMPRKFNSFVDFIQRAASWLYRNSIRRAIPFERPVRYAGVDIFRDRKLGDSIFAGKYYRNLHADIPGYEGALVEGLKTVVKPGMTVVVIGTGLGVTAVVAAKLTGPSGSVICYEASQINVERAREAVRRNGVASFVQVNYALVGPAIGVYHDDDAAPSVDIVDLPDCDVLELDCEGSEKQIILNLPFSPRWILVETHGMNGAPTDEIANLLHKRGYATRDLGVAEPRSAAWCEANDIHVLAAEYRTTS